MLIYIAKIFKLISATSLQRNTKVGNSGFVPPVYKIREDAGLQTNKDGRKELLRIKCKTHAHEQHGRKGCNRTSIASEGKYK